MTKLDISYCCEAKKRHKINFPLFNFLRRKDKQLIFLILDVHDEALLTHLNAVRPEIEELEVTKLAEGPDGN